MRKSFWVLLAAFSLLAGVQEVLAQTRIQEGLQALYGFQEGSGDQVFDISGVGAPLNLTISDPATVQWLPGGGLLLLNPSAISSLTSADKLNTALTASEALTIEAWIIPSSIGQVGPARIAALSVDEFPTGGNFILGQNDDRVEVRLRSTTTDQYGRPELITAPGSLGTNLMHVVFTRSPGGATQLFIDGALAATGETEGDLSNWDSACVLTLGNEPSGDRPWTGTLHMLAVYDDALKSFEVLQNFLSGHLLVTGPTVYYVSTAGSDVPPGVGSELYPFATIQHAIDQCADGDEVRVLPGTYTGDGNRDIDFGGKAIIVKSRDEDPATVTIDCQGTKAEPHRGFIFQNDEGRGSVLIGMTITNGLVLDNAGGGILLEGTDPSLPPFNVQDGSSPTLRSCDIINNTGCGLRIQGTLADPDISDCRFNNNEGDGVRADYSGNEFVDCEMSYNTVYGAHHYYYDGFFRLTGCEVLGNGSDGIIISFESDVELYQCLVDGNQGNGLTVFGTEYESILIQDSTISNNLGAGVDSEYQWFSFSAFNSDFSGNGDGGLKLGLPNYDICTIDNCTILDNSSHGIELSRIGFMNQQPKELLFPSAFLNIYDCEIGRNQGTGILGDLEANNPSTISGTKIFDNRGDGIHLILDPGDDIVNGGDLPSSLRLDRVTIAGNDGAGFHADIDSLFFQNVLISGNGAEAFVPVDVGFLDVGCSDIYANGGGDWEGLLAGLVGTAGNISVPPLFCDAPNNDFTLISSSACLEINQPVETACGNMGSEPEGCSFGGLHLVSPAGSDTTGNGTLDLPLATVQAAILAARDGDEVVLLPGTYTGPGNRDIRPLGKAVIIRSSDDDPATCILDCQGSELEPHRGFVFMDGETPATVLRGVTVRNGVAQNGGAIHLGDPADMFDESSPTLENCVFEDNLALGEGGGVFGNSGSSPLISNCRFLDNSATQGGGLNFLWLNSGVVTDCLFEGNSATGGGGGVASPWEQSNQFTDCRFINNSASLGGGFYNPLGISKAQEEKAGQARMGDGFTGCDFVGNTADSGGAFYARDTTAFILSDCLFENNSATLEGGAVYDHHTNNRYEYCVFAGNSAPTGGAMAVYGDGNPDPFSESRISHSTFAGNSGDVGSAVAYLDVQLWEFEIHNSIIADGLGLGAISVDGPTPPLLTCTDIYGNAGGDWTGAIADQLGTGGNLSVDPIFCGPMNSPDDPYSLFQTSPCVAENNPGCGQIGARGIGCYEIPVVEPIITSVVDVDNDQGGQVRLIWERCDFDVAGSDTVITGYGVYRLHDGNKNSSDPVPVEDKLAGWDFLITVPARQDEFYQYVAPTLCDSTIVAGLCNSTFMVSAMTPDPGVYFDSLPVSGYSTDDLGPAVPGNFFVGYGADQNTLAWSDPVDPDWSHFLVFRVRLSRDRPELDATPLVTLRDVNWTDPLVEAEGDAWDYFYWVAAVDSSGNRSELVSHQLLSAVDGEGVPFRTALVGNAPNPFNPRTAIAFELVQAREVDLVVFDISGRVIRTLLKGQAYAAGRHEIVWQGRDDTGRQVAAGVYFTRFAAGNIVQTKRMTLLK